VADEQFKVELQRLDKDGASVLASFPLSVGTSNFGRGKEWQIDDRRVSRAHCALVVDAVTRSVTLVPNAFNASYLRRKSGELLPLQPNAPLAVQHGDVLALLEGFIQFRFSIASEFDMHEPLSTLDALHSDADGTLMPAQLPQAAIHAAYLAVANSSNNGNHAAAAVPAAVPAAAGASDDEILIDKSEIEEIRPIGSGSCGEVVLARWRGGLVACKKIFRALIHGDALQEFMAEVRIMRRLRHPHIVLYMGMYNAAGETGIVTEYLRRGSLADVLAAEGKQLSVARLMHMAGDTARGMNYLHACRPPIIHRDLKSHNLLVADGDTIKVTDFGLARQVERDGRANTFCGTLPWTAPEVFAGTRGYTEKADVYSFGVVLWELCARGTVEPYAGFMPPAIIVGVTRGTLRPADIPGAPAPLMQLAARCWAHAPADRPTMGECLRELTDAEELADKEEEERVAAEKMMSAASSRKRTSRDEDDNDGASCSSNHETEWAPAEVTRRFHEASQRPDDDDDANDDDDDDDDDGVGGGTAGGGQSGGAGVQRSAKRRKNVERSLTSAWEIDATEITFENELGAGTSAVVYRGSYRGQPVAIKVLKDAAPDDEFRKELEIMAAIRSPNVVFFYGAMFRPKTALVVEFFKYGSLYDVMRGESSDVLFDWDLVLRLALGASRAVAALHAWKPVIVHRDLKSPNLLVDDSFSVKVGDFGLARFKTDVNRQTLTQLRGTYAYLAPESYQGQEFTTKSDVYSLAIILWELVNRLITGEHKRPYEDLKHLRFDYQIIIQTAKNGLRPVVHASCPPPLTQLMQRGWHVDPDQRPTAEQMRDSLLAIQRLYEQQKRGQSE